MRGSLPRNLGTEFMTKQAEFQRKFSSIAEAQTDNRDASTNSPPLAEATSLPLLASLAAIALDLVASGRAIDIAPIQRLGLRLHDRLTPKIPVSGELQLRLTNAATDELLLRMTSSSTAWSKESLESERDAAKSFVRDSKGDAAFLLSLGKDRLSNMRDFALALSIAARLPRTSPMIHASRIKA